MSLLLLQNWFDVYFLPILKDNAEMIDVLIEQHGLSPTEKLVCLIKTLISTSMYICMQSTKFCCFYPCSFVG